MSPWHASYKENRAPWLSFGLNAKICSNTLYGFLRAAEAPEAQSVSMQAAQERAIVEAAPCEHAVEHIGKRQLADPHADLVVNERAHRGSIEQLASEVCVRVEAAQVPKQGVHDELTGTVEVAGRRPLGTGTAGSTPTRVETHQVADPRAAPWWAAPSRRSFASAAHRRASRRCRPAAFVLARRQET